MKTHNPEGSTPAAATKQAVWGAFLLLHPHGTKAIRHYTEQPHASQHDRIATCQTHKETSPDNIQKTMREIKRIFIHCTASSQETTVATLLSLFRARGWRNPGYHYVITPQGETVSLLSETLVSNGVKGYNATAINIAYIGGTDSSGHPADTRTIEQKAAIVHLLLELRSRYPKARIMGHRDIWSTSNPAKWHKACPSFNATKEYECI